MNEGGKIKGIFVTHDQPSFFSSMKCEMDNFLLVNCDFHGSLDVGFHEMSSKYFIFLVNCDFYYTVCC